MQKYDLSKIEYDVIRTNKKKEYINIECGFDIETTSTYLADEEKTAFMYLWTFGLKDSDFIVHGRTWNEFLILCDDLKEHFKLSEDRILPCYVHNLGYEFQFMRKYFKWESIFSIDERKPIKALSSIGIEFKCSYVLSGFSLSNTANNLTKHKIEKLDGDLNYNLVRHSKTKITDEELQYAVNDVLIILYYINEQIDLYGDITKIPMTNTGRVRKFVRDKCYYTDSNHRKSSQGKFDRYRKIMEDLTLTPELYKMCKRGFMGGFTHANANYSGQIIDDVTSIDFTSSYPAVMLAEKFPMSKGIKTEFTKEKDFNYYRKRFALLFDVKFENIQSKIHFENYISESKCGTLVNPILNNGRVYSADTLITTITDVDFNIIENAYQWDNMQVANVYRFYRGYLPKPIIESIFELYEDKTVLKDVAGYEVEYVLSKGMLNSVYGMSVTDVVRDEIVYNEYHDWEVEPADEQEQIDKYNKGISRFLYYPWGLWVTAYARRNLWYGIMSIGEDYIYSDTDSIKFKNYEKHKPFIKKYDEVLIEKLKIMCNNYNLDFNKLKPKTKDGEEKIIGIWDIDGHYSRFKTLGAKRYLVEYKDSKEMELTVAGLSKNNGMKYLLEKGGNNDGAFELFNDSLFVPPEKTGKMTHTYLDREREFTIQDYRGVECRVKTLSGVHLEKCDFTLSISRQYIDFMDNLRKGYLYKGLDFK